MRLELVESVLKRDRLLILSNLAVIVLLAWIFLFIKLKRLSF